MKPSSRHRRLAPTLALFAGACATTALLACGGGSTAPDDPLGDSADASATDAGAIAVGEGGGSSADSGKHAVTDAGEAPTGDASVDPAAPDATTSDAGGSDGSADGGSDASDASDGGADAAPDGGPSAACVAILANHLASYLAPPQHFAGFGLEAGFAGTESLGALDPEGCYPAITEDYAQNPGYLKHGASGIQLYTNLDTDQVYLITADSTFTGSISFDSLATSPYGAHHYYAAIGALTKDGVDFPIDWTAPQASLQELYTVLVAAFGMGSEPVSDCVSAGYCLENTDPNQRVFGVRTPLYFYIEFDSTTNKPDGFYTFQNGAAASCSTPKSITQQWIYKLITPPEGAGIGGLQLENDEGQPELDESNANYRLCGTGTPGPQTASGDTISWANGSFTLAYGPLSMYGTKLSTGPGYMGFFYADTTDGHEYDAGLGYFTLDGVDLDILAGGDAALTAFSNAVRYSYFVDAAPSTSCISDGTCTLTMDDVPGQTTLTLPSSGLAFIFDTATHEPIEIDEISAPQP